MFSMNRIVPVTLALAAYTVAQTRNCPNDALDLNGQKLCGDNQFYDSSLLKCCEALPGETVQNGKLVGSNSSANCITALYVGGQARCATGYSFDSSMNQCCPSSNSAVGGSYNCQDVVIPSRPNDCANNAQLCNNTVYYDLMTQQCPRTCGRCNLVTGSQNSQILANCKDGVNASGISECPDKWRFCNQSGPIWATFMAKECPFTCGKCYVTSNTIMSNFPPTSTVSTTSASSTEATTQAATTS